MAAALLAAHGLSESDALSEADGLAALADRDAVDSRLRSLGIAKIGQRCRIALALQSREAAPSSTPQAAGLRVAVVCNSSYFAGASYGGAVRASLALLREIRRICGSAGSSTLDIFGILPKPVPAAVRLAWRGKVSLAPQKSSSCASNTPSRSDVTRL